MSRLKSSDTGGKWFGLNPKVVFPEYGNEYYTGIFLADRNFNFLRFYLQIERYCADVFFFKKKKIKKNK